MIHPRTRNPLNTDRYLGFRVQIADVYDPQAHNPVGMFVSRKLNGIRCLAHLSPGQRPRYYTKNGHEITGLDRLDESMTRATAQLGIDCVLDGELSLVTDTGADDFNTLVSVIQKRNHIVENPRFHAFDLIPTASFVSGRNKTLFHDRYLALDLSDVETPQLRLVTQRKITSQDDFRSEVARAAANGWEGLILRANVPYSGQISDNILKVREWDDAELPIVGFRQDQGSITTIQVEFFGRSLDLPTTDLPTEQLQDLTHSQLLQSVATVRWDQNTLANPRAVTLYAGGRKF